MTNIIQQQEMLKNLSDQQITEEMQQPSGQMPLYLVSTEAKRRADLRERFKAEQSGTPPATTVQEDLLRSILNAQTPQTGIMQGVPQNRPSQMAPQAQVAPAVSVAPQNTQMRPQQPQMAPQAAPQVLPSNTLKPRGFAEGGIVSTMDNNSGMVQVQLGDGRFVWVPAKPPLPNRLRENLADDTMRQQLSDIEDTMYPPTSKLAEDYDYTPAPETLAPARLDRAGFDAVAPDQSGIMAAVVPDTQPVVTPQPPQVAASDYDLSKLLPSTATTAPTYDYKKEVGDIYKDLSTRDDPYAGVAAKLKEREADLEGAEDKNFWLAVARAGMGAAGGQSPHAMANLAAGGMQGLDAYIKGDVSIDRRRDDILDREATLVANQEALDAAYRAEAQTTARGVLAGEQFKTETAATAKQREFDNNFAVGKLQSMLSERRAGRTDAMTIANMDKDTRMAIANLPPALVRSFDAAFAMPEGEEKTKLIDTLTGEGARDSKALVAAGGKFDKAFAEFMKDNDAAPATEAEWDNVRVRMGGRTGLFDVFKMSKLAEMGKTSSGSSARGHIENGKWVPD